MVYKLQKSILITNIKNILITLLFLFTVNTLYAQPFWKQIRPQASSNHFYAVHMFDSTTIWGFGQAGMMLYSEDFGKNWHAYYKSGFQENIYACHFFNDKHGIIVGEKGVIYKTFDQCRTWELINSPVKTSLKSVKFIKSFGVAVGENGTIMRSDDNGNTWDIVKIKGKYDFNSVFLLSDKKWFIVGNNGVIVETKTAGNTWKVSYHQSGQKLNDIYFINANKGFISSTKGLLLTTLNGGNSWASNIIARKRDLYQIKFIDENNGLIAGEGGIIERTFNGGTKWSDRFSAGVLDLYALDLWDIDHGILLGEGGNRTLIKHNANRFFTDVFKNGSTLLNLNAISSVDQNTIFAAGDNGQFILLEDKGDSVTFPSSKTPQKFNDVFFVNNRDGWAVGQDGEVRISVNGGKNWMYQYSGITYEDLNSVVFTNENSGWIVGEKGTMLQTYNRGTNWNKYNAHTTINLNGISFADEYNGFVVGDSGFFMTSNNGGNFWEKQFFPSEDNLKVITMTTYYGYVITEKGCLFRTFNKGKTWQQILLKSAYELKEVFSFYNFTWLVGDNGKIMYSNNNLFDWTEVFSTTRHELNDIDFFDFQTGYTCGNYGTILKFTGDKSKLDSAVIKQGGAVFDFEFPQDVMTDAVLKDIKGKVVAKFFDKVFKKGSYYFYIPAQEYNLTKGIYFIEVTYAEIKDRKKIVVF